MCKLNELMLLSTLVLGVSMTSLAQPQIQFHQGVTAGGISPNGFVIGGEPVSLEPVKGAPYSAEAIAETTQTLPGGNRATSTTSTRIYRDRDGRERREEALDPSTGRSATPNRPPTVYISDPVAGANYMLNVLGHTAVRMPKPSAPPLPPSGNSGAGNSAGGFSPSVTFQPTPGPGGAGASPWIVVQGNGNHIESTGPTPVPAAPVSPTRIERLEPRMIEGLRAEGTRMVETIPMGRAGNAQPIEMVTETWTAPELKVELLTRHSDPRTGETVYRLTNISRAEPDPSLFEVPADYSISEMPGISGGMFTGGVSVGPVAPQR